MSVHYKFKSALDYDTVTFDGLHISVGDLKASISQQKRIGKTSDFDLQITNAQTKEVYVDDNTLIPKNTSLLVARVPLSQQPKKQWEGSGSSSSGLHKDVGINKGLADLSRMEGTEQEKINAMISQSTFDYDPSNYQKIRGQNQRGIVPTNYICYKCQKRGHWIKDCPSANSGEPIEIRRSTGIPRSFMVPVDGPKAPGAMMTPSGTFAVPAVDHEAYLASESAVGADMPANAPAAPEPTVPDELICSLCRDLLTDAVMIPCCGNSFCDECIRGALLESEDHECPDCREKEIAPTTLIPNRFLRNSVSSFRNQTGYSRRTPHRPCAAPAQLPPQELQQQPPNGPMQPAPNAGPPLNLKPPGIETPPNIARVDEQRASTPTIDERRDPMSSQLVYNRGPPPPFVPGMPPPASRFANPPAPSPRGSHYAPRADPYPPDPYQPPPPGIKDSPTNGGGDDPLEAFNRMIREKEMRAKLREQERRRMQSGSRSPRVRSRSPRSPRSLRSPRSPRSPLSPRPRLRSPVVVRPRYTRSRSLSRGRARRSPWSPRRRRSRDRSISLTRSPSPRRRVRSPLRYRSPLRSPLRSPVRSPVRSPLRSPARSPRSPRRSALRSPPPRNLSPHRFVGVYDELLSPPRRSVEPPYGARYGARSNIPPQNYPPMAVKQISSAAVPALGEPTGYRGRYDIPPYEDIPPGVDPPVPGFEPSPFEKPPFGPPGPIERDRIPPPNFRDQYRPPPYADGPAGYPRDMSIPPLISEIPVHVGEQSLRYRDNYRPGPPYRDQGAIPFRDGQPFRDPGQPTPYRDNAFRGAPQYRDSSFRNNSYRDGGFRENPPHNFREGPFRPPSADPREPPIGGYNENNYREAFRDDNNGIRDHRAGFRPNNRSRGNSRRNPNEHDRHKEREGRDKDRYVENRDPSEKAREGDKRIGYEKSRDGREGREVREGRDGREVRDSREGREERREYDRGRDYERGPYEKEKERDHDRNTPDKKLRSPPKRSREVREKKRSESRDRLRESESKRDKKDDRVRDKSSDDRSKEHKEKEKKIKERKKKKRDKEKEKESEKKKKRDRKEKKDKDLPKKENDNLEKIETLNVTDNILGKKNSNEKSNETAENNLLEKISSNETSENQEKTEKSNNDLYGDEASEAVDKAIIETYVKAEKVEEKTLNKTVDTVNKDEPFDGIELQANADELDLKTEIETTNNKEMFAPLPELSKWEVDEDNPEKSKEPGEITSPEEEENSGKVTSEVIKRAENAIFAKAINSLRPIEIKKINSDRAKLYTDEADPKSSMNNIQITVPVIDSDQRSIEVNERKRRYSKTPPPRLSIKERLGGKVDDNHRPRDTRFVQSTVERVKSRSKTPKKEQGYRKVTVDRDRGRKVEGINRVDSKTDKRIVTDVIKTEIKHRGRSPNKESKRKDTDNKISKDNRKNENHESRFKVDEKKEGKNLNAERERKKSTLDEAHFEPDYDETVESDNETKEQTIKKRDNSHAVGPSESKKPKLEQDTITLDLANVKKKPDTESESSSDTESSSSSSSSDARKRKKKKKRAKKKKKRTVSDSESETDSSSDDHKKKKKKRKHKKKSSKKKKRSKHK